ncbi:MAG TPA: hypothetical protein VK158_05680 [Acidobacteriota bacterium]|nr:hypothetical protein [Acidobacteriota bacterium]
MRPGAKSPGNGLYLTVGVKPMDEKKKREDEQNRNKGQDQHGNMTGADQTQNESTTGEDQSMEDFSDTKRPTERDKIPTANQRKPVKTE